MESRILDFQFQEDSVFDFDFDFRLHKLTFFP